MFFKEFQELLGETVIEELLDITNLYAFEAKINHSPVLIMNVTPIGAARDNLIGMVFEEHISLDKNRASIIRIIEIPYLYRLDRKEIGTEIIAKINREGYLQ